MATNDRSLGYSVFFTSEGVEALKRVLAELSGQLDTLGKKVVAPELDIDDRKGKEKVGAFARDLQTRIDAAIKALPEIDLKAAATDVERRIAAIRAELESISHARVGVGIDAPGVHERIQELSAELRHLGTESANVKVTAGTAEAAAQLDEIGAKRVHVPVEVDTAPADAEVTVFARVLHERITAAIQSLPAVDIHAGSSDVDRRIAEIRAELDSLSDRRVTVTATGVVETATRVQELSAELVVLGEQSPEVKVRAEATRAAADLRGIKRLSDDVSKVVATARVVADTETASENVGSFSRGLVTRIDAAVASLPVVQLREDSTEVDQGVARLRTELSELSGKVKFGADASEVDTRVREIKTELTELGSRTTDVSVKADTAEAATNLAALTKRPERVELEVGTARAAAEVSAFADTLQTRITAAIKALPAVGLRVGDDDVQRRVAEIRTELAGLSQELIRPDLDPVNVDRKVRALARELDELGARTTNIGVKADTAEAAANLDALGHREFVANLRLGTREAQTEVDAFATKVYSQPITADLGVGTRKATADVDTFAVALQARIQAAVAALPDIVPKLDATNVDRRVAEIRAELKTLADQRIGVGVETGNGAQRIHALAVELRDLSTQSVDVKVKTETAAAASELDGLKTSAGRPIDIPVHADHASVDDLVGKLATIRDKRINLEITAREAAIEIDGIVSKLAIISGSHPDVTVRARAREAMTEVSGLLTELGKVSLEVTAPVSVDTKRATADVGSFARDLQTRIEAAIKALPPIELHAESSDADRRIAAIRAELVALKDTKVGVGITDAEASTRIRGFARELDDLSRHSVEIPVVANTTRAATALDGLNRKLDTDTGLRVVEVDANTGATNGKLGTVVMALDDIQSKLNSIGRTHPEATITVHTAEALAGIEHVSVALDHMQAKLDGIDTGKITALAAALRSINTQPINVTPNVDTTSATTRLAGLRTPIIVPVHAQSPSPSGVPIGVPLTATTLTTAPTLTANATPFDIRIAQANIKLEELRAKKVSPELDLKIQKLIANRDQALVALEVLQRKNVTPEATVKMVSLFADLGMARAGLDDLNARRAHPEADLKRALLVAGVEESKLKLEELNNKRSSPQIDLLYKKSLEALSRVTRDLNVLDKKTATPEVDLKKEKLEAKRASIIETLATLDGMRGTPKLDAEAASLEAKVALGENQIRVLDKMTAKPKLDAEADVFESRIERITEQIHALDSQTSLSKLDKDIKAALANVDVLNQRIAEFQRQKASSKLDVDIIAAEANIAKLTAERDVFNKKTATKADLDLNTSKAEANAGQFATKLQTNLERAIKSLPAIELKDNATDEEKRIRSIRDELVAIADKKIGVGIPTDEALPRIKELEAELGRLGQKTPILSLRADVSAARTAMDDVGKAADEAGRKGKAAGANLGLNTGLVNRWQQLGAAILVAATAAGPALLALGGVAAAGTTGVVQGAFGVKTLFSGVGTGAKAIETADKQQTSQAATLAAQQVSSANAVTAANQAVASSIRGVTDATRAAATANTNADRTVRDSKRSVTDAIRGEVDAQRSAGVSVRNALYAEEQAEQSLQNAQQSELRAQQALIEARRSAQRQLEDLNLQVKDAALAERAAVLGIQQAQENLNKLLDTTAGTQKTLIQAEEDYARAVATGTKAEQDKARAILDTIRTKAQGPTAALDRAQAQLAFDQAVQHLQDQRFHNKQLAEDKALADKRGVDGNLQVVAAQQGVTSAVQATQNAQHALSQAQFAVVESQRAGSESVRKAQEQVAKANEALGVAQAAQIETQRAGLESITKANEAQVAAQRSLENATAQAAKVGVTSLDTLKSALDQLSPAGRLFAYFLHDTLTPQLHDIRDAVQAAGLPKMKTALENLGALGPTITAGLAGTASVIGDLAIQGSKMVTSGPWKADFATIMARNNRVLADFGHAGLSTADAFRNIATSAGPLEERLAKLGEAGAHSFQVWIQGQRDSGQLDKFFHDAGDEAIQLVKVLGQLATAAVNLITAVHPVSGVFVAVIGKLAEWIGMLARANPTVIATVAALGTLFGILSKLTGVSIGGILKGDAFVGLGSKIESAALSAGVFTEKVTGSAAAGQKIAVAGEKAGSVMSKLGAALPVVGVAVIGLSLAYDHFITSADGAATAMLKGGAAADEATAALKKQQDGVFASREEIAKATGGFSELGRGLQDWLIPGVKQATDEFNKQRAAMDPLTRAQADVTRAQAEYARAIETNDLPRAARAQKDFADATAEAARQTAIQTDGLKSDDQILAEHRDLLLGNLNGEIRVKDEMVAVTKSVAEHGKSVDIDTEAGRRNLEGLNNLTGTMNDNLTAMQKNGATQEDITNKANEYKTSLFNQAIQIGYTKDKAQHYVDTVLSIPKDRYTSFDNNAGIANRDTQNYIASLHSTQGTYVATVIANVDPANRVINDFIRNSEAIQITLQLAAGIGAVANRPRATGGIDLVTPMAVGGLRVMDTGIANIVSPNTPTLMGDHPTVNESYIPWTRTSRTDQIFDATATGIGRMVIPRGAPAPTPMAAGGINGPGSLDRDPSQPVAVEVGPRTLAMFTDLAKVLRDYTTATRPLPSPVASLAAASDHHDVTAKYRDVALNVTPIVVRQVTQNAGQLVTAGARIVQPTAGGVVRGTSSAVRTGDAGMNPTAFAGVIEAAITRALSNRPAGPPMVLSPGAEAAMTRAVSSGVHGAELRIRDDGQGGIARIANRQNREQARR